MLITAFLAAACLPAFGTAAAKIPEDEDGYNLWLRYAVITDSARLNSVKAAFTHVVVYGKTDSADGSNSAQLVLASALKELKRGFLGITGRELTESTAPEGEGALIVGLYNEPQIKSIPGIGVMPEDEAGEAYIIKSVTLSGKKVTVLAASGANGILYGAFRLLELIQCGTDVNALDCSDAPAVRWRVLDQWDNWNGSIERGYAGSSIYKWSALPDTVDGRYEDFARANASVGINTIVINNVNTQTDYLKPENLRKIKVLADIFRAYGIRLALTVRFDSPIALGGLSTADPLNKSVIDWWKSKFNEIYSLIPDFAGILVKADSEGQPGPSKYGRTHADGANMFSEILKLHNDAVVMWRAFVYGAVASSLSSDTVNQAYEFFKPLDGKFNDNVIIQSKNGPRDFLPCEPVAPLFGGLTDTNIGIELQITQEYTGQSTHLCYLAPMWKSYFDFDLMITENNPDTSEGTTLAKIVDGTVYGRSNTLVAGVANIGSDKNWTRLELAQANWYSFGRLAWNPSADTGEITDTWIKLTFGSDPGVVDTLTEILDGSLELFRSYTSPYGLGMTQSSSDHFTQGLETRNKNGIIRVDKTGIGTCRTSESTGLNTDSTKQYSKGVGEFLGNIDTCPEELLFWFHHVPYDFVMSDGRTMKESVISGLNSAPEKVLKMKTDIQALSGKIDNARLKRITASLGTQYTQAGIWKRAMLDFIAEKSGVTYSFTNLAKGKTAAASQARNDFTAANAVDGNADTRWATEREDTNEYIFVDLGSVRSVNLVTLIWENYSSRYVIEVAKVLTAADGSKQSDWTTVAECRGDEWNLSAYGKATTNVLFEETEARYVRMRTTEKNSGLWNSLYEFEVYGDDFGESARYVLEEDIKGATGFYSCGCTAESLKNLKSKVQSAEKLLSKANAADAELLSAVKSLKDAFDKLEFDDLARGAKARRNTVSSVNHAGNAVDGNGKATFWQAAEDIAVPGILTLDFRKTLTLDTVLIDWKSAASSYLIEISENGADWTVLKEVDRAAEGFDTDTDTLTLAAPISARMIRFTSVVRDAELSVYTLGVYNRSTAPAEDEGDIALPQDNEEKTEEKNNSVIPVIAVISGILLLAVCAVFATLTVKKRKKQGN